MGLAAVPLAAPSAPRHERHEPEETILYRIVANHLETFLAETCENSARANFHPVPPPDIYALEFIIERVYRRLVAWLRRRGLLAEYGYELERGEPSALEACVRASLSQTGLVRLDEREFVETTDRGARVDTAFAVPRRAKGKHGFEALGFNLHAGVRIEADDRVGRERLLRYCMRAPLSLERLSVLRDGRIAYELQRPWRGGETHRVMQPIELLARLSALVPPPRHPLIRFHGVLAPHSSWRRSVIPDPRHDERSAAVCADAPASDATREGAANKAPSAGIDQVRTSREPAVPGAPTEAVLDPARLMRLARPPPFEPGKARYSSGIWRIDWATLLKRVYDLDALACTCGGRLKFVEVVTETERARALLEELGLDSAAPPFARARSPTSDSDPPTADW